MGKRRLEDFHIERFVEASGLVMDEPLKPSESPDCLTRIGDSAVGIEHTQFFFPTPEGHIPRQQLNSLRRMAVEEARRRFRAAGGPALYVHPTFTGQRGPRTKQQAYDLADRLARVVAKNGWPEYPAYAHFEPWRDVREVASYFVMESVDGTDELWHGGGGGWVAAVEPTHVQTCIDAKEPLYPRYRSKAPSVWLLIVNDMIRGGTPCDLGGPAAAAEYRTSFDRVFWFELISGRSTELRRISIDRRAS
jgi:hypothetical protein